MPRFTIWLAAFTLSTSSFACEATIRLEDDGGANDDTSSATDGTGASSSEPDGASAGSGADDLAAVRQELVEACGAWCQTRCSPPTRHCARDCATEVDACLEEKLAAVKCASPGLTGPCPEEADAEACSDEWRAVRACLDVYLCGHAGHAEDTTCNDPPGGCDCNETCDDGHFVRQTCTLGPTNDEQICQCYFDGALLGECRQAAGSPRCMMGVGGHCCLQLVR